MVCERIICTLSIVLQESLHIQHIYSIVRVGGGLVTPSRGCSTPAFIVANVAREVSSDFV